MRWNDSGPLIPVKEGPLITYHEHQIPVPGEKGGPPVWTPVLSPSNDSSPVKGRLTAPLECPSDIPTDESFPAQTDSPPSSPPTMPCLLPIKTYPGKLQRKLPPIQVFSQKLENHPSPILPARRKKNERRCGRSYLHFFILKIY